MSITFTDAARDKALEIQKVENLGGMYLRLGVKGGGCSGFTYDIFFDDTPISDLDNEFTFGTLQVVVDPMSMQYLEGVVVDHVNTLVASGFKFTNPNAKSTCGCASSFSA